MTLAVSHGCAPVQHPPASRPECGCSHGANAVSPSRPSTSRHPASAFTSAFMSAPTTAPAARSNARSSSACVNARATAPRPIAP